MGEMQTDDLETHGLVKRTSVGQFKLIIYTDIVRKTDYHIAGAIDVIAFILKAIIFFNCFQKFSFFYED